MIRAKFKCHSVKAEAEFEHVNLQAVYSDDKSSENYSWSKWTPTGSLLMSITNPAARGKFEEGKEYFIEISAAS